MIAEGNIGSVIPDIRLMFDPFKSDILALRDGLLCIMIKDEFETLDKIVIKFVSDSLLMLNRVILSLMNDVILLFVEIFYQRSEDLFLLGILCIG